MAPRAAAARVNVAAGTRFLEVLAQWCTSAAEELLRTGLRKDYRLLSEELSQARGRLLDCETVVEILKGRAVALCEFDELSDNAPLNRVVRAACERLAQMEELSDRTRTRARRVVYRMDGVGALELPDLRVRVDRLSKEYSCVVPLALLVLAGCGISSTAGKQVGTAFLIRTPELIEDGMRNILTRLLPEAAITKRRVILGDSGLSMNPDLVFGAGSAVGDVKYRYLSADWNRADLNQSVAFATAFRCTRCVVVAFARDATSSLPKPVPVGPVSAACVGWIASESTEPAESFRRLGDSVRNWWAVANG
jgi:5-methylcytosine-specific restriction endonuclease McrBC regulatory subunit McrC